MLGPAWYSAKCVCSTRDIWFDPWQTICTLRKVCQAYLLRRKCLITCIQRGPKIGIVLRHRQLFCSNCLCSSQRKAIKGSLSLFLAFRVISCPGTIWPRDLARLTPWPATRTGAVCFSQNLGQPETPEITLARPNANTQYVLMACNSYTSAHSDRQGSP